MRAAAILMEHSPAMPPEALAHLVVAAVAWLPEPDRSLVAREFLELHWGPWLGGSCPIWGLA